MVLSIARQREKLAWTCYRVSFDHLYPAKAMKLMFKLFSISYYFLLNSRGMRTPHGEDLFMSCISELVLETREVCRLAFPIHFSCQTKNNHSSNLQLL